MKKDVKNYKKIRLKIIKNLNQNNLKCFTGSCPEIYLEKSFRKLKNFKSKRLINSKILGETSIALDVNHTLKYSLHKRKLLKLKKEIEKILGYK